MLDNLTDGNEAERIADSDLALACVRAREAVAANPADESAATRLVEIVERFARTVPPTRAAPELPDAVIRANQLIAAGQMEEAEILLRNHLKTYRNDPPAMHLMAEIAAHCGLREDAERILRHSAVIHAGSAEAWTNLGKTLHRIACEKDYPELIAESVAALDEAINLDPQNEDAMAYKAAILVQTRGLQEARAAYERLLRLNPTLFYWVHYGFLLKTIGEFGAGVAAYRTAVALDPTNGAGWWGLANLKVARFFADDIRRMREALADPKLPELRRVEINFALMRALDQAKDYEGAAHCLREANDLRNALQPPDPREARGHADFVKKVFTPEFVKSRDGWGDPARDPIFILGMPRSGSTLVEQILASHPAIEGTEELFVLLQISGELAAAFPGHEAAQILPGLDQQQLATLGNRYIALTKRYRLTDRPFFTDKNPANWQYTGLIHSMLPNAKIIDVRRNPMDCCFANYCQHFEAGAHFTYNQRELGRYYADYVQTMRRFDEVAPGRVHRLIHDDLVDNFEQEVRRLLEYVGVPFEESCLRFHETQRAIHTPSSEQVRQPINRSGFGRWRNYEPWLGELKDALGSTSVDWRK
jgi:tetratricopeptide (TPR) repeat protein